MLINTYLFNYTHGDIFVYGDTIKSCIAHMAVPGKSVEGLCQYSLVHNLRIFYKPKSTIGGFISKFFVNSLTKKYLVYSSWSDLQDYQKSLLDKNDLL